MSLQLDITCGGAFKETILSEIDAISQLMACSESPDATQRKVTESYKKMIATRKHILTQLDGMRV